MTTESKNKGGRPTLPDDERRVSYTMRYKPDHLAKIKAASKSEFDALLEAWKPKTKKPARGGPV
mgnify:CR=1 FL=1